MVPLFLVGFLATAAALHVAVPEEGVRLYAEYRSEKLAMLDAMKGSADIAAFGTSHVHCGFDPRAFDSEMRRLGALAPGSASVNLGVAGGSQTEQRAMALEYFRSLKANGVRPRLIVLELNAGANFTAQFLCHPRNINISDAGTLGFAKSLASSPLPTKQRLGRLGVALASTGMYVANVGMVSNAVFRHGLNASIYDEDTGDDRRGVKRGLSSPVQTAEVQRIFAVPASPKSAPAVLVEGNRRLVDELAAAAREDFGPNGVPRFVYLVTPHTDDRMTTVVYPDTVETSIGSVPIVDLGRIDRHPDLYQASLWLDAAHVNAPGAALMTRLLADEIARRQQAPNAVR